MPKKKKICCNIFMLLAITIKINVKFIIIISSINLLIQIRNYRF